MIGPDPFPPVLTPRRAPRDPPLLPRSLPRSLPLSLYSPPSISPSLPPPPSPPYPVRGLRPAANLRRPRPRRAAPACTSARPQAARRALQAGWRRAACGGISDPERRLRGPRSGGGTQKERESESVASGHSPPCFTRHGGAVPCSGTCSLSSRLKFFTEVTCLDPVVRNRPFGPVH
jgi:hypothetical protein